MILKILQKSDIDTEINKQVYELFKQLNPNIKQLDVGTVLNQGNDFVFICCWDNDQLIGMATLATYRVISGYKGMVEDVIVSSDRRGEGIGRKLMLKLLEEGQKLKLNEILLFSGHHRKPAIQLYKSLGFNQKESGMYTLKL